MLNVRDPIAALPMSPLYSVLHCVPMFPTIFFLMAFSEPLHKADSSGELMPPGETVSY